MQVVESLVNGIEQVDERVRVHSAQAMVEGDVCCASAGLRLPAPDAWQSFEGHEVVLAGDLPDTRTATFMDFRTDQGHDVRFFHVLPLARAGSSSNTAARTTATTARPSPATWRRCSR